MQNTLEDRQLNSPQECVDTIVEYLKEAGLLRAEETVGR